jgi:hypothetical protein
VNDWIKKEQKKPATRIFAPKSSGYFQVHSNNSNSNINVKTVKRSLEDENQEDKENHLFDRKDVILALRNENERFLFLLNLEPLKFLHLNEISKL